MSHPVFLILRLKARWMWNSLAAWGRLRPRPGRMGTPRKGGRGGILVAAVFAVFLFNGFQMANQAVRNVHNSLRPENVDVPEGRLEPSPEEAREVGGREHEAGKTGNAPEKESPPGELQGEKLDPAKERQPGDVPRGEKKAETDARGGRFGGRFGPRPGLFDWSAEPSILSSDAFRDRVSFLVLMVCLAIVLLGLGYTSGDLSRLEWEVEWLLALPVSLPVIYASRVIERMVLSLFGWLTLGPFYSVLLLHWGYGWTTLAWAPLLVLLTHFLIAVAIFALEVGLRRLFSAQALRTVQALGTLGGTVLFALSVSVCMPVAEGDYFLFDWLAKGGGMAEALPMGVALGALQSGTLSLFDCARMAAGVLIPAGAAWALIAAVARRGLEVLQGSSRGKRKIEWREPRGFLSGVLAKDLLLLRRDRTFFVQVAAVPLVMGGLQIWFNPAFLKAVSSPVDWGAIAFGLGSYTLLMSAPQVLLHERDALWLLYTVPESMSRTVFRKAWIWIGLAGLYAGGLFATGVAVRGGGVAQDALVLAWIALGIPLLGLAGAALGVLGANPLTTEVHHRMRTSAVYLMMLLGGMLTGALYWENGWNRGVLLVMFAALATALWQKAARRAEYLLDPSALPPRRVDLSDGLVSIFFFFYAQSLVGLILLGGGLDLWSTTLVSYVLAGALVLPAAVSVLWRAGVRMHGLLRFRVHRPGVLAEASLAGAGCAGIAVGYGVCVQWLVPGIETLLPKQPEIPLHILFPLAVLAAPFFEEILFRAFVFRGLRSTLRFFPAALLSALLFAIVHPVVAVVPVFCVGLAAAWVYERGRGLLAPMLLHGTYNALVLLSL